MYAERIKLFVRDDRSSSFFGDLYRLIDSADRLILSNGQADADCIVETVSDDYGELSVQASFHGSRVDTWCGATSEGTGASRTVVFPNATFVSLLRIRRCLPALKSVSGVVILPATYGGKSQTGPISSVRITDVLRSKFVQPDMMIRLSRVVAAQTDCHLLLLRLEFNRKCEDSEIIESVRQEKKIFTFPQPIGVYDTALIAEYFREREPHLSGFCQTVLLQQTLETIDKVANVVVATHETSVFAELVDELQQIDPSISSGLASLLSRYGNINRGMGT